MAGLIESFAAQVGWPRLGSCTVIVEGTSDVEMLELARRLHRDACGVDLFADGFSVVPAGIRERGGVDGVYNMLQAARTNAALDCNPQGALRFRFIGLFDADGEGRRKYDLACQIDRYGTFPWQDVVLLHPHMPRADFFSDPSVAARATQLNAPYRGLVWEIEDVVGEDLKRRFDMSHPDVASRTTLCGDRTHRELTHDEKREFQAFVAASACIADLEGVVALIQALRSYAGLPAV
ncbi:MAG TPA: hypothetical protein VGN75_10485 [Kaistia sp.]|jgi:hypothetical protein|nr:hypothetical protein [Kaistia sp.]